MSRKITDYTRFLSRASRQRRPSAIRQLQPLVSLPGMISLGGGMPAPQTFPITQLSFKVKPLPEAVQVQNGSDRQEDVLLELTQQELNTALQYSPTAGLPSLKQQLHDLIRRHHDPPLQGDEHDICVTTGSQEALSRAFDMLLDPHDSILIEDPTYSGTLASLLPLEPRHVLVETDDLGLKPECLAAILDAWDSNSQDPKPKVLYTIPTGANPSGATMPLERRHQVYDIARQHDLIVLEDDPYYYLQYRDRISSLTSIDVDGRVLRFDSMSKIVSSGLRLGMVSGPAPLIHQIVLHGQAVSLHASGMSQAVLSKLMDYWALEGFEQHIETVSAYYRAKADAMLQAVRKHLTGLASWNEDVSAGMFLWIKLHGVKDAKVLIEEHARKAKVLLLPGSVFRPDDGTPSSFIRASFSTASAEDMDEAMRRLAAILKEHACAGTS